MKKVAVFVGSASKTSFNHLAVKYLQKVAPASLELNVVDISDLPLYDRDLDEQDIPQYTRVREAIKAADAILWVSPEHNGGPSAMIKNAIDVGSRPMGQSVWNGKPLGLLSVNANGSPRVTDQLRTISTSPALNMPTLPFGAYFGGIFAGAFNEHGELVSEQAKAVLDGFINAYAEFVEKY
ncbi:NAD(P)H-dependent oxidoreductase [Moraxella sp. FZFQ2102]|uniref:NADPH-dependent FMN reductase n=1 Tax=Moraxella sp. FZFQ2102 TaxID=2953752 RepID=UPI00209BDFBA|nr:NADPH-dependent FMN reductase [Moraxella sp. FZFQ2102]USZ14403.1 NAD(P)H-dependent oxidoreductase [Moraxella sp. FZFQ2102]